MTTAGMKRMRKGPTYRELFFAHNGPGPYCCTFCAKDVGIVDLYVHHDDHDPNNNDPNNLKPAHPGCHAGHHRRDLVATGRTKHTDESRAKISAALRGRKRSSAHTAAIVSGKHAAAEARGYYHSPETRQKISDAGLRNGGTIV